MTTHSDIEKLAEVKAASKVIGMETAPALWAIACAIFRLAEAQEKTATMLDHLGFNGSLSKDALGTTEMLSLAVERVADALEQMAPE